MQAIYSLRLSTREISMRKFLITIALCLSLISQFDGSGMAQSGITPKYTTPSVYTVASQAAMLALAAKAGDYALRTDTGNSYILKTLPASVLGNWAIISTYQPTSWLDASNYATLALAEAAAYAAGKTLVVSTSVNLVANLNVRCPLKIVKGGLITQTGSFTITMSSDFEAGLYQVFSGFSPGQVTGLKEARPEWWGANYLAFTCAAQSGDSTYGSVVRFSKGIYDYGDNRVNIPNPVVIEGEGESTVLVWDVTGMSAPGDDNVGILNIYHPGGSGNWLDHVILRNLSIDFGGSRATGYSVGKTGVNIYSAKNITVDHVYFKGGIGEMLMIGQKVQSGTTGVMITGCRAYDFAAAAFNIVNASNVRIVNNLFEQGNIPLEIGVESNNWVISSNVMKDMYGYVWIGGIANLTMTGNTLVDVGLTNQGVVTGAIYIAFDGTDEQTVSGIIGNNTIENITGSNPNGCGIAIVGDYHDIIPDGLSITNNTVLKYTIGIYADAMKNGAIIGNTVKTTGGGTGIGFAASADIAANIINGNYVTGYAANYADNSTAQTNRWGINYDEVGNGRLYGQTGRQNDGITLAISSGGTIAHGLGVIPEVIIATAQDGTPLVVTAADATNLTITFAGGGTKTIYWRVVKR
jgi:hypothetical protein